MICLKNFICRGQGSGARFVWDSTVGASRLGTHVLAQKRRWTLVVEKSTHLNHRYFERFAPTSETAVVAVFAHGSIFTFLM